MVEGDGPKGKKSERSRPNPDRVSILARRKFFIASALAGITAASCNNKEPQVCLKVMSQPEPDAAAPQPCLDVLTEADKDSAAAAAPSAVPDPTPTQEPKVCLKIAAPPKEEPAPKVCLRFAAPPKEDPKL